MLYLISLEWFFERNSQAQTCAHTHKTPVLMGLHDKRWIQFKKKVMLLVITI